MAQLSAQLPVQPGLFQPGRPGGITAVPGSLGITAKVSIGAGAGTFGVGAAAVTAHASIGAGGVTARFGVASVTASMSVGVVGQQLPFGAVSPSAHVSVSVISIVTRFTSVAITAKTSISAYGGISGVTPISPILATPAVVVSHAYISASQVIKVQFATTQSPPAEIVFFDTFQNGRYLPPPAGSYAWNDQEDWNTVGMGDVQVSFNAQTLTPTIVRGASLVSPSGHNNGIVSAPFQTSPKGYVTFAVRLNIVSVPATNPNFFTEYPIYLQLCLWNGSGNAPTVLQQWALSANTVGQTIEQYFSYLVGSATGGSTSEFLCLAVAQHSGAACPAGQTASWTIQAASAFDPSIVWSFSSDSSTWVDAVSVNPVRNNRNGITSLASPSTSLYWKCTIYRPDMYVTSLKLRPWYLGSDLPRLAPVAEGPNLTFSDPDQTIWTDPEFNTWALPVPIWWFARYAQLNFFPDGVPTVVPSSTHFVLTANESIGSVTDTSCVSYYQQSYKTPENVGPVSDVATAYGTYHLTASESVGPTSDSSTAALVDVPAPPGNLAVTFSGHSPLPGLAEAGKVSVGFGTTALAITTTTFDYTGGVQTWVVPAGINFITVTAIGAAGGGFGTGAGGLGAVVAATLAVTPGDTLSIYVGQWAGTGFATMFGYHTGGSGYSLELCSSGGGSSAIVSNYTGPLIEAGGGGGSVGLDSQYSGGHGGNPNGGNGLYSGGAPGGGATQTADGNGGAQKNGYASSTQAWSQGTNEELTGVGGAGGGGFFGGGAGSTYVAANGDTTSGAGGGGSSWASPTMATDISYGLQASPDYGQVTITY